MPDFAADDFAEIARRSKEIAAEENAPRCDKCNDRGWIQFGALDSNQPFLICPTCGNPRGMDRP